ncbi:hypothetical protein [Methylobacterium sp. P5_C11]
MARSKKSNLFKISISSVLYMSAVSAYPAEMISDNQAQPRSTGETTDKSNKLLVELPTRILSSEEGIEIDETGVNFLPDESGVACFTKLGRFHTDDRGIHIKYRKRAPEIYIHSEFDRKSNNYHIVFGNNFCRYTLTIQREIKKSGQWKSSTVSD